MSAKAWAVGMIVGAMSLAACSGPGGGGGASSILVMREGVADQSFASVRFSCTVMEPEPGVRLASIHCVHGDPEDLGIELSAVSETSFSDRPDGTALSQGTDFQVNAIGGAEDGAPWGASGDSSWWSGDLTITIGESTDDGRAAVFEGTMETTEAVEVRAITIDFAAVDATLR